MAAYVGLWSANCDLHLSLPELLAERGLGVVALPPDSPQPLLDHYVRLGALRALICDAPHAVLARQWQCRLPCIEIAPQARSHEVAATLAAAAPAAAGETPARLLFSSGTSGLPRAVLRPAGADHYRMRQFIERFDLHAGLHHIVAGPLYHSGPAIFARTHRQLDCPMTIFDHFDAGRLLSMLARTDQAIYSVFLVPVQLHRLEQARHAAGLSWSVYDSIARLWVAGSRCEPELKLSMAGHLQPGRMWEFYGATETGTITIQNQDEMTARPGSVGRPVPGVRLQIRDAQGHALTPGHTGRLWVASPMNAQAVLGTPALEQDGLGYLCLGDCGWLDAEGYLYLTGREADMLISGGVNVYPAQVEDALRQIPEVAQALAFGLPDERWGDRIEALVVADGNPQDTQAVQARLRQLLPAAARPKRLHWVDELPLTVSGKPDRLAARKWALNVL